MSDVIEVIRSEAIAEVVMNSPPVNSLSHELLEGLDSVVCQLSEDRNIRAVLLESGLKNVFMAGADLKMLLSLSKSQLHEYMQKIQTVFNKFEALPQPTIAVIGGHAMGGGCELSLCCDFRYMSSNGARIGLPEIKLGLMPAGGGIQRLRRLIGASRAFELLISGTAMTAPEALRISLVDKVFENDLLVTESRKKAQELAVKPTRAISEIKRCLRSSDDQAVSAGLDAALKGIVALVKETEDAREGVAAFNEKREARFRGC